MAILDVAGALQPLAVEVPIVPAIATLLGGFLLVLVTVQALRTGQKSPRPTARIPAPAPLTPPPAPAPAPVQYKRAPVVIHFPQVRSGFPDTWGVQDPIDIVVRVEDKQLQEMRQIPGLTLQIDGETLQPVFQRGTTGVRRSFARPGERTVTVDVKAPGESQPRRTTRNLRIVEYRAEIADVFANFREEASKTITPIREDATPWEIYDLLTGANPRIPGNTLREIVASFEEAKYSNHPVTRATYERMIHALLELEKVEL